MFASKSDTGSRRLTRSSCLLAVWTLALLAGRSAFALTPLNALRYAPNLTVVLGDTTVTPQNVAEDNLAGGVTLVPIGTIPKGTDVLAYYQLAGGDQLLAFDIPVSLAGGILARPGDVVRFNGTTYTKYFDAAANGMPAGAMTDAVSLIGGTDLLLSFDVTVVLGSITARPADLVRFNGSTFSLLFNGASAGAPTGLNLDGAYYVEASGHLLLSFDGSGTVGGVTFRAHDVLEYTPGSGTWEKAYNGAAQFAAWAPANLVGPFVLLSVCGNGVVEGREQCDDGNTANGDCCSSTCQRETNGGQCPVCGAANGQTFTAAPTTDLCTTGTASAVTGSGPWSWTCTGPTAGVTVNCSANIASYTITFVAGANGSISGSLSQTVKHGASTTDVTALPDEGYHFVDWTDQSGSVVSAATVLVLTNVTSNRTLTANFARMPVDGVCGAANGQTFTTAPTTGLCATGTASAVTGSGPWSWSCAGLYGGATASCSAQPPPPCVPQPAGLVSWWTGSGNASDAVGGKNGTFVSGATYSTGKVGKGFTLNGMHQYISLPDSTVQSHGAWTIEAWFKTSSGGVIVGAQAGQYGATLNTGVTVWDPLLFAGTDGKLRGGVWPAQLYSSQTVVDGNWHHAAVSYENGTVRLYLDGALVGSASGITPQQWPVNQIGTGYTVYWDAGNNGWFDFNGQIDEVTIFNRALDAVDIQATYNAGSSGMCIAPPVQGTLDVSFNKTGFVVTDVAEDWSEANAVAVDPNGKIVVAGYKGGGGKLLVARYLPDGTLDPAFGEGKGYVIPIAAQSHAYGLALDNGKIVVVGDYPRGGDWQVLIAVLTESGAVDTTFGGTGYVTWNNGRYSEAAGVVIQDGKILVTGFTNVDSSDRDLLLLRYNWNGSLDTSFGPAHTGVVTVPAITYDGSRGGKPLSLPNIEGKAVAVQSWDSKLVVLAQSDSPAYAAVYRFTAAGALDTAFGAGGVTVPYNGNVTGQETGAYGGSASGVALQSDHKILMAGVGRRDDGFRTVVLRYTETGQIDTDYGTGGEGSYTGTPSGSEIRGLALADDGKSVVVGTIVGQLHPGNNNPQSDVVILRFTGQGTLDATFGEGGVLLFNGPGNWTDEGRAVAVQANGKIIAVGGTQKTGDSGSRDVLVLRLTSLPSFIHVVPATNPFDFGSVAVLASQVQSFTVANDGVSATALGQLTIAGPNQADFVRQYDTCSNQTVASGAACSYDVVFSPGAVGARTATLSIPSNDPGQSTLTLALNGTGTTVASLRTDLTEIADRIPLDDISRFPEWGTVQINGEVINYKGKKAAAGAASAAAAQPGDLLIVRRGVDDTTTAAHSAGAPVVLLPSPACIGDCNVDGQVTVDDLLRAVGVALGNASVAECNAGDVNADDRVAVDEILAAVYNALNGCGAGG